MRFEVWDQGVVMLVAASARRMFAIVITSVVVTGLIPLQPAQAAAAPPKVLAGGRDTSSQWRAYSIRSNGGDYQFDWTMDVKKKPVQIGAYIYNGDDLFQAGFNWTAFTYQDSSHYEVNVIPGQPIIGEPTIDADGYRQKVSVGGRLYGTEDEPKITKVLVWSSGDLSGGVDWKLSTGPDAAIATENGQVAATSGKDAFVHLSEDFKGVAKGGVQRRVPPTPVGSGVGARGAAAMSLTYQVKHAFVGSFSMLGAGSPYAAQAYGLKVSGPDGYEKTCAVDQCTWYNAKPTLTPRPGSYRFDLTGAGVGIGTFGDVLLWGVDAYLPPGRDPDPAPFVVGTPSVDQGVQGVNVSGRAHFPVLPITSAKDSADDGTSGPVPAATILAAELTGAGISYDPQEQNLLVRSDLPMHDAYVAGTPPGLMYGTEFVVGGTRYEVRVMKNAATSAPSASSIEQYMALFRCAPDCVEQRRLSGTWGWFRDMVLAEVPLSAIAAVEGSALTGIRSFTAIGEAQPGAIQQIDEVALPSAVIPQTRVEVGIAPASTPASEVTFDLQAELSKGLFTRSIPTQGMSQGNYRVWIRPCLGSICAVPEFADLTL